MPHLSNRASRWRLWLRSAVAVSTTDEGNLAALYGGTVAELQLEPADERCGNVAARKISAAATTVGRLFCSISLTGEQTNQTAVGGDVSMNA